MNYRIIVVALAALCASFGKSLAADPAAVARGKYLVTIASCHDCHTPGYFLGKPDMETGETTVIEPKTQNAGTRRVWPDSKGRLWVSEWNAGNLSLYDPASKTWTVYRLPGHEPHAYAVYVDDVGDRFQRQRYSELRPQEQVVPGLPKRQARRRGTSAQRPGGRGLGCRVRS